MAGGSVVDELAVVVTRAVTAARAVDVLGSGPVAAAHAFATRLTVVTHGHFLLVWCGLAGYGRALTAGPAVGVRGIRLLAARG